MKPFNLIFFAGLFLTSLHSLANRDCTAPGCEFQFHASECNPSGPTREGPRYPNDYAKTFYCDAPWRTRSLDEPLTLDFQIEGTDVDAIDELHCIAVYDVSDGSEPPTPVEDFWGDYEYTPDHPNQIYKSDCLGCELQDDTTGMFFLSVNTFRNDGAFHGSQPTGTLLTARNLGYTDADLGRCITLTFRIIYEESLNWTDIHDQDAKIYIGTSPLPALDHWYLGDTHTHTWSTYYFLEMGASGPVMYESMKTSGLDWMLVSDHAFNLTDAKWATITSECATGTIPGEFIALRGEECDDGYTLDASHHFLAFDIDSWIPTYGEDPSVAESLADITAQGGFSYGAHTSDPSWPWTDQEILDALAFDCFRGVEDYNSRNPYSSEDTLHPWGASPATGTWSVTNTDWDQPIVDGIRKWDRILSQIIDSPRHAFFFMGGSDAHGSMNYHVDWDVLRNPDPPGDASRDILYVANSNALGKVRTAAYCPAGLTQPALLEALRAGETVVTDGPMVVIGIETTSVPTGYGDCELRIGMTGSLPVDSGGHLFVEWIGSQDYGSVSTIRILRGDASTGESPVEITTLPLQDGFQGNQVIPLSDLIDPTYNDGDPEPDFYIRAEAYTYDPLIGPDAPGDVSMPDYDPLGNAYQYRAITNPIWINVTSPSETPTASPSASPSRTPSPAPSSTVTPSATPSPTQSATAPPSPTTTGTPTSTGTPTPTPTPAFTSTFTPSETPSPSASPSAAPSRTPSPGCSSIRASIEMPSEFYRPGDPFELTVAICAADSWIGIDRPLFVILDVYGMYFFAPSFSPFDQYNHHFSEAFSRLTVIPRFNWPADCGSATGIRWYAAFTDPEIMRIEGEWDSMEFGWSDSFGS